jgi:AhpD family alkylhydroperoxidase
VKTHHSPFRRRALAAPTSSYFGGYRGRTQTLGEWLAGIRWILVRRSDVWAIAVKRRIEPALREAVMVAVADVNACRFCSYAHQMHALHHGLSEEDVALITAGSPALGDARLATATAYARERAEVGFAPVAAGQRGPLVAVLGARAADDVEVVARLMHAANMVANAMDALPARMGGRVPAGSRLRDDLVLGAVAMVAIVVLTPVFAFAWRRSPIAVARDMRSFVRSYEDRISRAAQ